MSKDSMQILAIVGSTLAVVISVLDVGWIATATMASVGLVLAAASLPWRYELSDTIGDIEYFCVWVIVWPFLIVWFLRLGVKKYLQLWWIAKARRDYEKSKSN